MSEHFHLGGWFQFRETSSPIGGTEIGSTFLKGGLAVSDLRCACPLTHFSSKSVSNHHHECVRKSLVPYI